MMQLRVVANGDVRDATTWSGTPAALTAAFEREGVAVVGVDASLSGADARILGLAGIAVYGRGGRAFSPYLPLTTQVQKFRLRGPLRHDDDIFATLHTDTMWMGRLAAAGQDHYLYRDSSWRAFADAFHVQGRLRRVLDAQYMEAIQRVSAVFTTSRWARSEILAETGLSHDRVHVVGTGFRDVGSAPRASNKYTSGRTLCVARVRHTQKGVDLLLRAHRIARQSRPELHLDLVVPAGVAQTEAGVTIHSGISAGRLDELYASAALYCMPARYEPWGLVYLEAQARRTPVMGSLHGAFAELCAGGQSGFILRDLHPESIANALLAAHGDSMQLEALGVYGQEHVQAAFSWPCTARRILNVIRPCN